MTKSFVFVLQLNGIVELISEWKVEFNGKRLFDIQISLIPGVSCKLKWEIMK